MSEPRRALLVASTGGHLEQITRLERAFRPAFDEVDFATFDNMQSRSLLRGRRVHFVDYIPPRGIRESMRAQGPAIKIIREGRYTDVISTGAAIAGPFMLATCVTGTRGHYIESAARAQGPSLTGQTVARIPGVWLYAQYPTWSEPRWRYRGSVFDDFDVAENLSVSSRGPQRVVVTLGTIKPYEFRRAVRGVQRVLAQAAADDAEVLWQVGCTPVSDLGIRGVELVSTDELRSAIRESDVVFAHAGIGSCLQILDCGRVPILLPRERSRGEHVDDHQWMIAAELQRRQLAVSRDPDHLVGEDIFTAMSRVAQQRDLARVFELQVVPLSRYAVDRR